MSILDDFLTDDLEHLPNDAKNTAGNTLSNHASHHHKHHHAARTLNTHSALHARTGATNTNQTHSNQSTPPTASAQNCLPCRQKNAADFLAGNTPGVMAFYAPEEQRYAILAKTQHPCPQPANLAANTRADNATIEDAETVQRLVEWREEASY